MLSRLDVDTHVLPMAELLLAMLGLRCHAY